VSLFGVGAVGLLFPIRPSCSKTGKIGTPTTPWLFWVRVVNALADVDNPSLSAVYLGPVDGNNVMHIALMAQVRSAPLLIRTPHRFLNSGHAADTSPTNLATGSIPVPWIFTPGPRKIGTSDKH